jgi:thioredoxin-like negative regulator of GroEL
MLGMISDRAYGENAYFMNNLVDAIALSESSKKPVLVIFGADWCRYCGVLHKDLEDEDAAKALDDFIVCSIDIDKDKDLAKEYGVKSLPDSRIIKDKVEVSIYVGYKGKVKYLTWINDARQHK